MLKNESVNEIEITPAMALAACSALAESGLVPYGTHPNDQAMAEILKASLEAAGFAVRTHECLLPAS